MRKLEAIRADPDLVKKLKQHIIGKHGVLSGHLVNATDEALKNYLIAEGVIVE